MILFTVMALAVYLETAMFLQLQTVARTGTEVGELNQFLWGSDEEKWNKIQIWFECCGIDNYHYWRKNVPDSCCKDYNPR